MKIHPSITQDRLMKAVRRQQTSLDNPGFCILCGEEAEGCEPDAEKYTCEHCGADGVYGAEQLLILTV